jgi:hypothetical protein
MAVKGPTEFRMEDIVRLRRPHPCGGTDWRVVRLGADIGLKCLTCGHRVLLERPTLERRLKGFVGRGPYDPRDPWNASGHSEAEGQQNAANE